MGRMHVVLQRWYAHPDDLVGGWCVMNCDKPPSQARPKAGEFEVGSFLTEDVARHVVELHNRTLPERVG